MNQQYAARTFFILVVILAWGILASGASMAEAAPKIFSKPVSLYAERQDLPSVLASFARMQGLNASVAPSITGTLSGRFQNMAPNTFLEGLRAAFGVNWYKTGSTLHFYLENETTQEFYSPKVMSAAEIVSMLRSSSVLSPQLPPALDPNGGMMTIKGPPGYIAQVRSAAAALEDSFASRMTMKVFPLKYAWADDISVNSMDKTITVPGVASILRAMVTGSTTSSSGMTQQPATVPKLGGTGLIAQGRQQEAAPLPQQEARQGTDTGTGKPAANIMSDPRVNAVLIQDAEYRMPYYEKVIQDLDKPVELVEIHAAIVDIDTNFKRDLGVNYQFSTGAGDGWQGGGSLSPTGAAFNPTPPIGAATSAGLNLSTIYTKGAEYFLARVQALEEEGGARVLGRPSVLTVDNLQATLENTSTYYLQISGYQAVDLFKVEAGTVLRVTPHIIYDAGGKKSVKLAINVQDNQNDNSSQPSGVASVLPPIKQTRINTQAIVGAGQSLLIGGYYYEQKATTDNGIPILMHIPVIGNLFKTASKSAKRMERLILITPRVIALEDLPKTPDHVDDADFARSPTQQDYEPRQAPAVGGCSRTALRPADSVSGKNAEEAGNTL